MHKAWGGCTGGEGGMHVHPVHPPWVRPCSYVSDIETIAVRPCSYVSDIETIAEHTVQRPGDDATVALFSCHNQDCSAKHLSPVLLLVLLFQVLS